MEHFAGVMKRLAGVMKFKKYMKYEETRGFGFPIGWLIIGLIALFAFFSTIAHGQISRVESVGFTVSNMDKAIDFYTRVCRLRKFRTRKFGAIHLSIFRAFLGRVCGLCVFN